MLVKHMRYLTTNKLYCFSPPVMLATFLIEIILAIYTIVRYKLTPITRLAAAILVCLAVFQLAEYNVCEGSWGVDSLTWARIGYVAITLLPPLGLHLTTRVAGQRRLPLVLFSYILGLAFAIFFLFVGHGLQGQECLGNYVIFTIAPWAFLPYTIYYYGLTAAGVVYAGLAGKAMKSKSKKTALYALSAGYMGFIIPTTAINFIDPGTRSAIPSVMCGFAVILAIVLATIVIPRYYKK